MLFRHALFLLVALAFFSASMTAARAMVPAAAHHCADMDMSMETGMDMSKQAPVKPEPCKMDCCLVKAVPVAVTGAPARDFAFASYVSMAARFSPVGRAPLDRPPRNAA